MVIAMALGPDFGLYAVEYSSSFPTGLGQVVRISVGRSREVVADQLKQPGGITFDRAGDMYIVIGANDPVNGQILEYRHIARPW